MEEDQIKFESEQEQLAEEYAYRTTPQELVDYKISFQEMISIKKKAFVAGMQSLQKA